MSSGRTQFLLLSVLSVVLFGGLAGGAPSRERQIESSPEPHVSAATLAKMPIRFEANAGQHDESIRFVARRGATALALRDDGATLTIHPRAAATHAGEKPRRSSRVVLDLSVDGGRTVAPRASEELVTKTSYFVGSDRSKWRTDIASYAKVTYPGVLDGVDLVYHGENGALEYDFVVAPGASVDRVAMNVGGAKGLSLTDKGELRIETADGVVVQPPPVVYQRDAAGARHTVASSYRLVGPRRVGFRVSAYDRARPLVIDPVIGFSTFLGGTGYDTVTAIAVDTNGNTYVAGSTDSTDFPTANAYDSSINIDPECGNECYASSDAFVAKLDPTGQQLLFATYLGGNDQDAANAIAIANDGTAYVTGTTWSYDFPQMNGINSFTYTQDGFVARLGASGSSLLYSTYLSGSDDDAPTGIAVDGTGIYVAGNTRSTDLTAPNIVTSGAGPSTTVNGPPNNDAFFVKLTPAGDAVTYVKTLGGTSDEYVTGFAIDDSGRAYVAGYTYSGADFVQGTNALKPSCQGGESTDGFLARLNAPGTAFDFATCLGGTQNDEAHGIALDGAGNIYVAGLTFSSDFPTAGVPSSYSASADVFVTKLDTTGTQIVYSRFIGGTNYEGANAIAVDSSNGVWVTGGTRSSNYPTVAPIQSTFGGGGEAATDAFVTRLDSTGATLLFSTFLGGSTDYDEGIAIARNGTTVYVAGNTYSTDFPVYKARQSTNAGQQDGFVANVGVPPLLISPPSVLLAVGGTQQFTAVGGAGFGYTYSIQSNGSGGTITSDGLYTTGTFGNSVDVVAVTDAAGLTATATVQVGPNDSQPTAALGISPTNANLAPRAQATFVAGGGVPPYSWSFASNASGATITQTGVYTAGSEGNVTDIVRLTDSAGAFVQATIGVGAKISITPAKPSAPPNGSVSFSAHGGSGAGFTWSVSKNASGGTINPATGTYKAGGTSNTVDTVQVTDSLGNKAQVNVSVGGGLAVSPADPRVPTRGKVQFEAIGGSGAYTWSLTTSASGGTIDAATGAYVAGQNGNTTDVVVATDSLGNKASAQVTVGPGLTIAPVTSNVVAGAKIAFTAQGGSGVGYVFSFGANASGATLTKDGVYVAGAQGGTDAIHLVDSLGNTADAKVTVTAAPTPPGPTFDAGAPSSPTFDGGTLPGINLAGGGGNDNCSCRAVGTAGGDSHSAAGSLAALGFALGLVVRRRRRG